MQPIVIARAPLSISLGEHVIGRALDSKSSHRLVLRAAVDHYVYTIVTHGSGDAVRIVWAGCPAQSREEFEDGPPLGCDLNLPEVISERFNLRRGLTVFLAPQCQVCGGLGMLGSLAVSMIKALAFCSGIDLAPLEVADLACQVDAQATALSPTNASLYAAAYGGLSTIELGPRCSAAEPLPVSPDSWALLADSFMLFRATSPKAPSPYQMSGEPRRDTATGRGAGRSDEWVRAIRIALRQGDLLGVGQLLHRSWLESRQERGGDAHLDQCYLAARANGALGGYTGATMGQPFLGVFCKEDDQPGVIQALAAFGMERWPLRLVPEGVEVLEAMPRSWSKTTAPASMFAAMRP